MQLQSPLEEKLQALFDLDSSEPDSCPSLLKRAMGYSLLAPGKRIRPRLLLTTAELLGVNQQQALPAALALEMLHCFTLIHDDLPCLDDDDFRRGQLSNHRKFGESIALLAGDAMMPWAFQVFLDNPLREEAPERLLRGLERLIHSIGPSGVVGGQVEEEQLNADSSVQALERVQAMKTGVLFEAAVGIPLDFFGLSAESEQGKVLLGFGRCLGKSFQVADDLEDFLQDVESNAMHTTSPHPKQSLFHLPPQLLAQQTTKALTQSENALSTCFGTQANTLLQFSGEIKIAIEQALHKKF